MQKFTRSLTREVEIEGERLAVTFSNDGLELRPVGSRRPPLTVSWAGLLCTAVGPDAQPQGETVAQALHRLKHPPKPKKERTEPGSSPDAETPAGEEKSQATEPAPAIVPPSSPPVDERIQIEEMPPVGDIAPVLTPPSPRNEVPEGTPG